MLLIDAGNSRIKWALSSADGLEAHGVAETGAGLPAVLTQLPAQRGDHDLFDVGHRLVVFPPAARDDLAAGDHPAGTGNKQLEQGKLLRS